MITLDFSKVLKASTQLSLRLNQIPNFMDRAGPLMENLERIMEEDNLRGVLAGEDKDGRPAPALLYRPIGPAGKKLTVAQRLGQHPNKRRGEYSGIGPAAGGLLANNNLTTAEYRKLDGKRLAPRGQFSRVITNFFTTSFQMNEPGQWKAIGGWREVVSPKGFHFLPCHFDGQGQQRYDLRGVRPAGMDEFRQSLLAWAKSTVRELWKRVV